MISAIEFFGNAAMQEIAGEDYAGNRKKELEDSAKEILKELLDDLVEDLVSIYHEEIPQQKFWEWVKTIAQKEIGNANP